MALLAPEAEGLKFKTMVQLADGASVAPLIHVDCELLIEKSAALAPVMESVFRLIAGVPTLFKVMVIGVAEVPSVAVPKAALLLDNDKGPWPW